MKSSLGLFALVLAIALSSPAAGYQTDGWYFHFGEGPVPVSGCLGSQWGGAQFPADDVAGWLSACAGEPNPPSPPYTGLYCLGGILGVRRYAPSTFVGDYADYSYVRLAVTLAPGENVTQGDIYAAADDAIKLFVNGQEFGVVGGCEGTLPEHTNIDIRNLLVPGVNDFRAIYQDAACCGSDFTAILYLETTRTWHVPSDAATIQAAIDLAESGDSVIVAPGIYTGLGNKNLDFGGKGLVLSSSGGPTVTIIDCQASAGNPARGFDFHSGETSSSVLDGVTIQNGWEENGGGLRVINNSQPQIKNCVFLRNTADGADGGGGGIYCENTAPAITACVFEANHVVSPGFYGGAIFAFLEGNISIANCTFRHNTAERGPAISTGAGSIVGSHFIANTGGNEGGALRIWGACTVSNCQFQDNSANLGDGDGGAIWARVTGATTVSNCSFVRNSANRHGGAYREAGSENAAVAQFTGCTFFGNAAGSSGSSMWLEGPSFVTVDRSILAFAGPGPAFDCTGASTLSLSCSDVFGNEGGDWTGCISGQQGGFGNFTANPQFCSPSGDDLSLFSSSPCLPGNHPNGANCGLIGAFGQGCATPATSVAGMVLSEKELEIVPNPAPGGHTEIRFGLAEEKSVEIGIFDVSGRRVRTLAAERLGAGPQAIAWDGSDDAGHGVPAGIYFARLVGIGKGPVTERIVVAR